MTGLAAADRRAAEDAAAPGLVQRLEPRVRVVLAAAFALACVSLSSPALLATAFALAVVLAVQARLPALPTLRRMAGMDAFMVPVVLFLPFTVPGETLAGLGPLAVTAEGMQRAAAIVLTANAVVLALTALVGTIEPATLGHALARLRVPRKIVSLLLFTFRYVEVLHSEYSRMRLAMKARAFQAAGTLHTWRSLGYLFGMLLVRSLDRSERILAAMKCRGFAGRYLVPDARPPGILDWAFGGVLTAALGALLATQALA
jgi:cobalt/nickel transport system permease protein